MSPDGYFWYFSGSHFLGRHRSCEHQMLRAGLYQHPISSEQYLWWRHQMETLSTLLALCAGNSSLTGEFPSKRPVPRSFDVSWICALNRRLSKQSWGWWFETSSRPLWCHCNVSNMTDRVPEKSLQLWSICLISVVSNVTVSGKRPIGAWVLKRLKT